MNADIPVTTRLMMDLGTAISKNPVGSGVTLVVSVIGMLILLRFRAVREALMRVLWRLPAVGDLMKQLALA
ncbi:hypothetical protein ABTM05_19720, partial [Acinetobacter baumannii]